MILQPVSDQTLSGGLSLGSQPLLYQLPGAALWVARPRLWSWFSLTPLCPIPLASWAHCHCFPLGSSPGLAEAQDQRAANHHAAGRQPRGSCPRSPCCVGLTAGLPAARWERGSTVEEG